MNAASRTTSAKSALSYCVQQVRNYDYHHYLCLLQLPLEMRKAAFAIRAFNVETAKAMDVASDPRIGLMRLVWWRDTIDKIWQNQLVEHPIASALSEVIGEHKLSKVWLKRSVDARIKDAQREPGEIPETMEEVEKYAEDTQSTILYLTLQAGGIESTAADHAASHIGKAGGILLLLRSLPYHVSKQRQFAYIPLDIAEKSGLLVDQGGGREISLESREGLCNAVFQMASVANAHLQKARELTKTIHVEAVPALLPAVPAQVLLDSLSRVNFDVYDARFTRGILGDMTGTFSIMTGLPFSYNGPWILHKQQNKYGRLQFDKSKYPLLILCWKKGPKRESSLKKHEAHPQNVDLPPVLPKKKKKPFPIPISIIQRNARADKKLAELGIEKPLEPPKNGLLVPELIPIAYEVVDAWKDLIKGVAQLLHVIPVYACSECPEVHVADAGHRIQNCEGSASRKRKGFHSWIRGSITDVLIPIDSYHLFDPFGRRVKHETRFDYDRIPAVVELCIQAGVDLPDFPSRRRTRPIRVIGKKIIDGGGFLEEPPRPNTPSSVLTELDTQGALSRFPPPDASDIPQIAQETIKAYETVAVGVRRLMGKYSVKACGYCPEVHVGPWGHDAKLCGAFKHQWRDGKHGWQDAIVNEVFPSNYVWHVRDPKGPPLTTALKTFYGKAPAVVELCMQGGAWVPRRHLPMMRLDIVLPESEEANLVA